MARHLPCKFLGSQMEALFGCFTRDRVDGNVNAAIAFGFETHMTFRDCENRMVCADANIAARVPFRAALAAYNVARDHAFAAEPLDAEAF